MEAFVREYSLDVATVIDAASVLIIVVGVIMAFVDWGFAFSRRATGDGALTVVRLGLAQRLTLALEFLIASDIIRTAVAPSFTELGQLAAIVLLRVVIVYSLEHDTGTLARRAAPPDPQSAPE